MPWFNSTMPTVSRVLSANFLRAELRQIESRHEIGITTQRLP